MKSQRYRLGLGDGVYGPGDVEPLTVTSIRVLKGPNLPNWQPEVLLAALEKPIQWRGQPVSYVTLSPRHVGGTVFGMQREGGVVAVGRVLPGHNPLLWEKLLPLGLDYWAVGTLALLEP
jgi:hypothetical protein